MLHLVFNFSNNFLFTSVIKALLALILSWASLRDRPWPQTVGFKMQVQGCLGGSAGEASDLGSGHDRTVHELEPCVGLCADTSELGACF